MCGDGGAESCGLGVPEEVGSGDVSGSGVGCSDSVGAGDGLAEGMVGWTTTVTLCATGDGWAGAGAGGRGGRGGFGWVLTGVSGLSGGGSSGGFWHSVTMPQGHWNQFLGSAVDSEFLGGA
jgi:hypothetical protein